MSSRAESAEREIIENQLVGLAIDKGDGSTWEGRQAGTRSRRQALESPKAPPDFAQALVYFRGGRRARTQRQEGTAPRSLFFSFLGLLPSG